MLLQALPSSGPSTARQAQKGDSPPGSWTLARWLLDRDPPAHQPEIPTKRTLRVQHSVQRPIYALRNRIERCINRVKNCLCVATRYDNTASSFLGFVQLAAIRLWISFVHAT